MQPTKRLEILNNSLAKKQKIFNDLFIAHTEEVKKAQGEPLRCNRRGNKILNTWEKTAQRLTIKLKEIKKTQRAIDREKYKSQKKEKALMKHQPHIKKMIEDGILSIWRKHERIAFVVGVDRARIYFEEVDGVYYLEGHKFYNQIECQEQKEKFKTIYNDIRAKETPKPKKERQEQKEWPQEMLDVVGKEFDGVTVKKCRNTLPTIKIKKNKITYVIGTYHVWSKSFESLEEAIKYALTLH